MRDSFDFQIIQPNVRRQPMAGVEMATGEQQMSRIAAVGSGEMVNQNNQVLPVFFLDRTPECLLSGPAGGIAEERLVRGRKPVKCSVDDSKRGQRSEIDVGLGDESVWIAGGQRSECVQNGVVPAIPLVFKQRLQEISSGVINWQKPLVGRSGILLSDCGDAAGGGQDESHQAEWLQLSSKRFHNIEP